MSSIQLNNDSSEADTFFNTGGGLLANTIDSYNSSSVFTQATLDFTNAKSFAIGAATDQSESFNTTTNALTDKLSAANGTSLGTLVYTPSGTTAVLTLPDTTVINLTSVPSTTAIGAVAGTPELTLLAYLADLGDSTTASALDTVNFNYLNPTGTAYGATGSVTGTTVTFTLNGPPGAVVAGILGDTNIINGSSDITNDSLSYIQEFNMTNATLSLAEFNSFTQVAGGGTLTLATAGTYNFNASRVSGAFTNIIAQDWQGTTITGNNLVGQTLTASLFGNDTLNAGSGAGDKLVAGEGVDHLNGGNGGNTFVVTNGLASGSVLTGGTGANILSATYGGGIDDISLATITGIQTLQLASGTNLALTHSEFAAFGGTTGITSGTASTLTATTGGTYSVASETGIGTGFSMIAADTVDAIALIGNNVANQTLNADNSAGNDTLTLGSGNDDFIYADGTTGTNTITTADASGNSFGDIVSAKNSSGVNTITVGAAAHDQIVVDGSSGNNILATGNGAGDIISAQNSSGNNRLTAGSGTFDVLNATGSIGNNTLIAGIGGDVLTGGYGVTTFTGASGNDTFIVNAGTAGTTVAGGGGTDVIDSYASDLTGVSITGVAGLQLVAPSVAITSSQFAAFTAFDNPGSSQEVIDIANASGTYSLTGKTVIGNVGLSAVGSTAAVTLTATAAGEVLASGSGTDTLTAMSGGNILIAGTGVGTLIGSSGNDTFQIGNNLASGTTINGSTGTNKVDFVATANIGSATITNAPNLQIDNGAMPEMTSSQYAAFTSLTNTGSTGVMVDITNASGSYSLSGKTVTGNVGLSALGSSAAVTLTASNTVGEELQAGSGTDTLIAGTGGDVLIAGAGVDTMTGGSGNDLFDVGNNLASGDVLNGGTGTNGIQVTAAASLTAATISNITSLEIESGASATITSAQFTAFTSYTADAGAGAVNLSTAGTYSLSSKTVTGGLTLAATGTGNYTLTGNNTASQTLTGNTGTDTITSGTGSGDVINSNGTNDSDTLNATNGWINLNGTGDHVTMNGAGDTGVSNSTGQTITSSGNGETVDFYGTSSTTTIGGTTTWAFMYGNSNTLTTNVGSTGDNITASGTGEHVTLNGDYGTVTATNTGDVIAITGANEWANVNGNTDSVTLTDTAGFGNSSIIVNGNSDTITTNGNNNGDYVALNGSSDTLTINGHDLWVDVNGAGTR